MHRLLLILCLMYLGSDVAVAQDHPKTVEALFSEFDPQKAPLETKIVRAWEKDGIVYRYVTFTIGTFKDKPARMAGFFGFPKGAKNLPGLLHLHGGGQRAFLHEVEFYSKRGYACLSINWGGREMEGAKLNDASTDWGAVDPTQKNVPGYFNLKPGDKYLDPVDSPRNNNWYLLTLGSRRGLTFLEQQPEVDADHLGVYGHSMGGNLTVFVAGTDDRVKVAAPSVGGSGFRTYPWPLLPQHKPRAPNGDLTLFRATLAFQSYSPLIKAPTLWLGATNDFHGIMDDTYSTGELIPHENVRYSFTPHMNHRFTPEFAVTRPLWIDKHLKESFEFPTTPKSKLLISTDDQIPVLQVTPDSTMPVERIHVLYSIDPDPQARFWRTAEAERKDDMWFAKLPVMSVKQPLFAFANVHYRLDKSEIASFAQPTESFAISSMLHTATQKQMQNATVKATDKSSLLIDDFSHGWQDWYLLSGGNPHHWEYSTRKINDSKWRGEDGFQLAFDVQADKPNELVVVVTENFFRSYRGRSQLYIAVVKLNGGKEAQTVMLEPQDLKTSDGIALDSWKSLDLLSFRAYYDKGEKLLGSKQWAGPQPKFQILRWIDSEAK